MNLFYFTEEEILFREVKLFVRTMLQGLIEVIPINDLTFFLPYINHVEK